MSAIDDHPSIALTHVDVPVATRGRWLKIVRWVAIGVWAVVVVFRTVTDGFAFNRELLLLYICTGLAAASIGQGRRMLYVVRDWLPFALVLVAYDLSRGAATLIGRPTMWHWQADADRWLFFGTMPTVWLQERLKLPHPPWWEVVISTVYMSFFILPYVVAGVLWLRNRDEWKAFIKLFVGLSFASLIIYALLPAAPPWAAARCTAADVERGPSGPRCMFRPARGVPDGGLLGAMQTNQDGARLDRADSRAWLGQAEPALRHRVDRPGPGQRQPGRRRPLAARGSDPGNRGVPVESHPSRMASAAGGLCARHGVHFGLHRRALRHRHSARLGAGGHRSGGHRTPRGTATVAVADTPGKGPACRC